ncbi:MAG: type II toxin-antitoxin system VapC family toxin [Aridibacter sp.]
MPHLFDTNCFLRLADKNSPQRIIVLDAIRKLRSNNETLYYTPQILAEFWNVCTRPTSARGGFGLSVEQTERKANLIDKCFLTLPDNPVTFNDWRKLVSDHKVKGLQVHDTKIVASMNVHNIQTLVTFNEKKISEDLQR